MLKTEPKISNTIIIIFFVTVLVLQFLINNYSSLEYREILQTVFIVVLISIFLVYYFYERYKISKRDIFCYSEFYPERELDLKNDYKTFYFEVGFEEISDNSRRTIDNLKLELTYPDLHKQIFSKDDKNYSLDNINIVGANRSYRGVVRIKLTDLKKGKYKFRYFGDEKEEELKQIAVYGYRRG